MRTFLLLGLALSLSTAGVACGDDGSADSGPRDGGSRDGGSRDGGSRDARVPDATAMTDAPSDAGPGDGGTDAGPPTCDDLPGQYTVSEVGADCGAIATGQTITIMRADNPSVCIMEISSDGEPVLSGSAPVEADGTFSETTLGLGGDFDQNCMGRFTSAGLEVSCTSTTSGDTCTLRFTRD